MVRGSGSVKESGSVEGSGLVEGLGSVDISGLVEGFGLVGGSGLVEDLDQLLKWVRLMDLVWLEELV